MTPWPWCTAPPPPPPVFPPRWLPYYHDQHLLARSGLHATLGVFRIVWSALKHRHEAISAAFSLPDPGRVAPDQAPALLAAYTASLQALVNLGVYRDPCGNVVSTVLNAPSWPGSVPNLLSVFPLLRWARRTVMEEDVQIAVAPHVRTGDLLATWAVPRFVNCLRVRSVSLVPVAGDPRMGGALHRCDNSAPVEAFYGRMPWYFVPAEPAMPVEPGTFTLEDISAVRPNGYEDEPPPPNCEYRYFLQGTIENSVVVINGVGYTVDGEGPLDVTHAISTTNLMTIARWRAGPWSHGNLTLREVLQWNGTGTPPATLENRFRQFVRLGQRPWGNLGGSERVAFRIEGTVELFVSGPFAPPLPDAHTAPRVDLLPRHVLPGTTVTAGFNPPSDSVMSWEAFLNGNLVASGTISGETTHLQFQIPDGFEGRGLLEIRAGGKIIRDTLLGPVGRPYCEILSYEVSLFEEEQPGVIVRGSRIAVRRSSPDRLWPAPAGNWTLYLRIRVADGELFSAGSFAASLAGGVLTAGSVSSSLLAGESGKFSDVAFVRSGGVLSVWINSVWAASGTVPGTFPADALTLVDGYQGRLYRAILLTEALSGPDLESLSLHGSPDVRWPRTAFDLDTHPGVGLYLPDRTANLAEADADPGLEHVFPTSYGLRSTVRTFRASDLGGPRLLYQLPRHCLAVRTEFEVLGAITGSTFDVGYAGFPDFLLSGVDLSTPGLQVHTNRYGPRPPLHTPITIVPNGTPAGGWVRVRSVYQVLGLPSEPGSA